MIRIHALSILGALLILVHTGAAQVTVTFRLNTCTVYNDDITATSLVQVRGSIAPLTWGDHSVDMLPAGGDYWEVDVVFDASEVGNTLVYKFYAEEWESGDNKQLVLDQDIVLDLAYFNQGYRPPYDETTDIDLWFRVNIESNALFDPETDEVGLRGGTAATGADIGNLSWGSSLVLSREDASFYYSGQAMIPPDSEGVGINYKFVRGAGPDEWETIYPRTLMVPRQDSTIVWVWWNNEEPEPTEIDTGVVMFQADMSILLANGWFDPGTEWISVRGNFEGWGNTDPMVPDPLDPTIYQWSYEIIQEHEATISWKFKAFPDENWINSGWEMGATREFTFIGDMTLPPAQPNLLPAGDPLNVDATVRFSVDMTDAVCWYTGDPFPMIESVWLAGDDGIGPLQWPTWQPDDTVSMVRLYDNGTNGDQVAGDEIWTVDLFMPTGTASTILYKYSVYYTGVDTLNAGSVPMDNEAGFAVNHATVLDTDETFQELPTDVFGDQVTVGPMYLHIDLIGPALGTLSWAPVLIASEYHIWRGMSPYPDASGSSWQTVGSQTTSLDLTEGIGDESINYFYIGRAAYGAVLSDPSNIVGEMDYEAEIP